MPILNLNFNYAILIILSHMFLKTAYRSSLKSGEKIRQIAFLIFVQDTYMYNLVKIDFLGHFWEKNQCFCIFYTLRALYCMILMSYRR